MDSFFIIIEKEKTGNKTEIKKVDGYILQIDNRKVGIKVNQYRDGSHSWSIYDLTTGLEMAMLSFFPDNLVGRKSLREIIACFDKDMAKDIEYKEKCIAEINCCSKN